MESRRGIGPRRLPAVLQTAAHTSEMRDMALPPGVEPSKQPSEGRQQNPLPEARQACAGMDSNHRTRGTRFTVWRD